MRCINCGWNNPDGVSRCQKCNQLLPIVPIMEEKMDVSQPAKKQEAPFRATQRDLSAITLGNRAEEMRSTVRSVASVVEGLVQAGPVDAAVVSYQLVPLEGGEAVFCPELPFAINRSVVPAAGASIDAKCQAELSVSEGKLFIQDKSEVGSTYVLAKRKILIEPGDIVMMGGRRFIVE